MLVAIRDDDDLDAASSVTVETDPPATDAPSRLPAPGNAIMDGERYTIIKSCPVFPNASNSAACQIESFLIQNESRRAIVDRWLDGGSSGVGLYRPATFGL